MTIYSSNCCAKAGWNLFHIETPADDLLVSIAPDADLDGKVSGFCHDEQEMLTINGWLCVFHQLCPNTGDYLNSDDGEYLGVTL